MSTDYQPGTVAIATVRGCRNTRIFRTGSPAFGKWIAAEASMPQTLWLDASDVTDIRPLVVLDLEALPSYLSGWADAADVLRNQDTETGRAIAEQIEAQTKPPRIPEPGLYGVVREANGRELFRYSLVAKRAWTTEGGNRLGWDEIDNDPVLVREGLS